MSKFISRRSFGGVMAGALTAVVAASRSVRSAAPDGVGAIMDMIAGLKGAKALSFTAQSVFGASVSRDKLRTLGDRASVVFDRSGSLFAAFGSGGQPDVQMLIAGGEATLYRPSLGAKTTLKLVPDNGAAFLVPGVFVPFLGLVADDPETAFFGGIRSVTAIAQGLPDQPEQTNLVAVMGKGFTGEIWVDKSTGLPVRTNGTWFGSGGDLAASAAVDLSGWTSEQPVAEAFVIKGLNDAKAVELDALGL